MKILNCLAIFCLAFLFNITSSALTTDANKPVDISSDEVDLNFKTGQRTFIGNVRLIQGSLKLRADHLEASYKNGELIEAIAKGNPAAFKQRADGKTSDDEGEGKTIILLQKENTLELKKKAVLIQEGNTARGDYIFYNRSSGKLKVRGGAQASSGNEKGEEVKKELQNDPFFNKKAEASNKPSSSNATKPRTSTTAKPEKLILPGKTKSTKPDEEKSSGRSRLIIIPKSK